MPISLPSTYTPLGLASTYATPEENAAAAMAAEQDNLSNNTAFGRGLSRGLYQTPALLANTAGQVVEPFAPQFSKPIFDWASEQNRAAQGLYAPEDIRSYDQVNGLGDAASLAAGAFGENLPQIPLTIGSALAARFGLRNVAMNPWLKTGAGAMAGSLPMNMGENVQSVRDDPMAMANSTPMERLGKTFAAAVPQAALDSVADTLLMGRATGLGKTVSNVFKDGLGKTAKDAALHIGKAVPEAALTEGLPEAGQELIKQQLMTNLNPERNKSGDEHALLDSFFKGWAAGAPSSAVGRGTDVAWAQGRGATEAIRGLLTPKRLPESLTLSNDKDILNWDAQDNEQRNNWAKGLADNIMNSDASQGMKEAAQGFYEKMASGVKNAWAGLSEAVGAEDKVARGRESLDRFFSSVKKANEAVGKANAEADPIDQDLYNNFAQHLDPKGAAARDTELKSRLFNTVKESLIDGDWQHLPWHELEDEFGTIGRATNAVVKLRENLVRAGQLEHDDEFGSLFEATIKEGQAGERAMMDVVKRYGREYINRDPSDSELRDTVRNIRKMLMNPEFMRKNKDAIDRQMAKAFGSEANAAKVLAALSPKNNVEAGIETEVENVDDTTGQTFKGKSAEEFAPGTRFIGSGVKGLRKQVASDEPGQNIVSNHGGFWPLGHSDEKTRAEIQGRFKDTAADLRKDGHYVRELTPLQYAAEAGVSVKKVATHILGRKAVSGMSDAEIAAALKDHPARMLAVDERDMEKDKLSLDNDDLLNLADKLKQSFSAFDKGMPMRDEGLRKQVAAALAKSGAEQRKAMKELGLEHGTKLRMGKGGAYLENNPRHGGNGVFNVHMADGTVRHISAQHLIATMRERGRGQFSNRSAYDMFNSGIAALMNIDGVQKVTTNDVWGREDDKPFDLKKGKNGKFKNYFQLEPGLNLGDAQRAARRGEFKDKVMEQLEAAYAAAEQSGDQGAIEEAQLAIDEELARRDALQDTLEGEGEREATAGSRSATDDTVTPGDHARETPLDFNDDGTPKHPYGKDVSRSIENVAFNFNGVAMRVRPGVAGKHFTDGARKVMAVAKALQKIKNSPTATSSRMDMALDLAARSAAAQKDGNTAARDAAIFAAADAIRQAALDEIEVAQNEGNEEAVDKLTTAAAKVIDLAAQYDPDTHDALLADYKPYRSKGGASQDTRTPAQVQREKAEAQKTEIIPTTPQPIIQSKTTDPLQKARDDLQGKKDAAQAMADEAKARAAADQAWMDLSEEERTEHVETVTKPVEQELTNLAKLNRSWGGLVKAARQALRTLKQAWINGELDRAELVKNLREAVSALKAVAGDVANVLRDAANATIRAYKEADAKYSTLFSSYVDKGKAAFKKLLGVEENQAPASTEDKLLQRAAKRFAGQFKTGMEIKPHESGLGPLGSYTTRMFEKDGQLVFMAVPDSLVKDVIDKFAADKGMDVEQVTTLMQNTMQQTPETGLPMSPFISTYNLSSNYLMVSSALDGSPAEALMRKHGVLDQTKGASGKVWNKFKNLGPIPTANLLGEFFARIQKHTGNDNITITRNRDTGGAAEHGKGKKKTSVFEKSDHSGKYDLNSPAVQKLVSDFHDVADEYLEGGKYESEEHVISDAKYRTLVGSGLLFQYNVRQHYALKATNTKKTLAIVKGFLLSRGLDVESTEFIVHESHNKASGFYDPVNNIISYSAQTLHHLAQEELTQEKVEALSTLIHEASHKVDLSMTLNGQAIAATEFNTALNADGAHRAEIEALHNSGKYGAFFEYPLNYESKMSEGLMKVELFAQANALYHTVGDEMKSLAPSLFKYLKGVNDAKTLRDQRAAIANTGQSGEEFEKDIGRLSSDAGDVFGTLENRGTDADRQGSRGAVHSEQVKHNAEGSFASGKGVSKAEFDAVKDYIGKVLGPKVKTMLVKDLGGNSAAWNRVNGETIVRIAANAANPLSKAHHEAMHEFFQRLMDAHPEAAEVLRTAADAPMVKRQIEQFFHNDANYAKIKAAIANDEHERVAYMFQLWAAGKLNVGPKTKNWFQKIKAFFQKAFGLLSNDQKAEAIMQAFHDGKMSEPSAVAEVLANDPKMVQGFLDRAGEWAAPIASKAKEALFTAQNILSESGNKGFQDIGKLFSTETGALAQEMSFMDAKVMKTNQMNDRVWAILKNADEKDIAAALEGLQRGETSKDADIAKLQGRLRTFLDQAHDYATKAGMDLKKVKDYFPRVWDPIAIAENKDKFVSMLQADHLAETGKPLSDTVAKGIATNLIANRGHEPVNEDELANGYSPFMAAANKRVLDFIKNPEFSEFQEKSMESILTTYIGQLVHKAEYTRRFGTNGDKLRDMVIDAVGEEVGPEWAAAKQAAQKKLDDLKKSYKGKPRAELSKKLAEMGYRYGGLEINHVHAELQGAEAKRKFSNYEGEMRRNIRAIMAMEGTLGADINPDIRKWSAGLIVYENMRLLGMSLFSQVIDPLGVMVRGGTVGNAWDTFKRGIAGTIAGWRGKPIDDSATRLAMQLGIIDAGGWMNSQGNAYTSLYMGKTAQKWNDRLFRFNGVEGFSQGTRVGAMTAAIEFLKHHSGLPSEHSERWLSELGLTQADVKLTNGELDYTNPKIQQAIFRWVEGAILRPNASMRPSWASDPHFALLFHLKQFTYAMQKVLLERVFNEAKHGNMDPGITMVLTYVPTMIAADFLRGLVANGGKEPPWKRNWTFGDYLAEGVQRAGLLGVPQFALDTAKWGPAELAGPVAEQLTKTGKTFYKDIKKDAYLDEVAGFTQAKRDIDRAAQFDGVEHAVKKTLRDALPINSLTKRYVYDEVVGK